MTEPFNLTDDQEAVLKPFSDHLQEGSMALIDKLAAAGLTQHQAGIVIRDEGFQLALHYEHAIRMDNDSTLSREKWLELAGVAYDEYEVIADMAHAINALMAVEGK